MNGPVWHWLQVQCVRLARAREAVPVAPHLPPAIKLALTLEDWPQDRALIVRPRASQMLVFLDTSAGPARDEVGAVGLPAIALVVAHVRRTS